jgi:hypothetical protein
VKKRSLRLQQKHEQKRNSANKRDQEVKEIVVAVIRPYSWFLVFSRGFLDSFAQRYEI